LEEVELVHRIRMMMMRILGLARLMVVELVHQTMTM
jgi:hypothetical protein